MKRNKKYTHLTARCYITAKQISICQLKKYCGYTLSEAYWRLDDGKGLMSLYDQESFEQWSEVMNGVARIKPLSRLMPIEYENFCAYRNLIWENMESYRHWLEHGTEPVYFRQIASSTGIDEVFLYKAAERLFELKKGVEEDDVLINHLINLAVKLDKDFELHRQEQLDRGEKPDELFLPYTKVYQIRTDYSHKQSDSDLIRSRLDGIWTITNKTSATDREIYEHNKLVIARYQNIRKRWAEDKNKQKMIHTDDNLWMNFLRDIRIPEYDKI